MSMLLGGDKRRRYGNLSQRAVMTVVGLCLFVLWVLFVGSTGSMVAFAVNSGGVTLAVLCRIPDALTKLREEQRRVRAERDAFQTFARRVADIDDENVQGGAGLSDSIQDTSDGILIRTYVSKTGSTPAIQVVQNLYRETVMAVPHYEDDYAESLETNMWTEFGPEIAASVVEGDALTPQLRIAVIQSAQDAKRDRSGLLRTLEQERENLITARRGISQFHENIETIEKSLHRRSVRELIEDWQRLDAFESHCRDVLTDRQDQLQESPDGRTILELQAYLYGADSWTYPVLNDGLDCISCVRTVKRDIVKALSKWR